MEKEEATVPWHKGTKASPSLTSHESLLAFLFAVVETRQLRHALHSASHSHKLGLRRLIVLYRTSAPANTMRPAGRNVLNIICIFISANRGSSGTNNSKHNIQQNKSTKEKRNLTTLSRRSQ